MTWCDNSNKAYKRDSPAYKNGSILTSIKIGNSFLTQLAVIQSASLERRQLARSCLISPYNDDMLREFLRSCGCCKFSLSISMEERFGQLRCNKRFMLLLLWRFPSLRDLNFVTSSRFSLASFHRCFCDLLHLFASSILTSSQTPSEHFSLLDDDNSFCVLHLRLLIDFELCVEWNCFKGVADDGTIMKEYALQMRNKKFHKIAH